jgi:drug/metabolite transporter (DMT)-like permease
MHKQKKEILKAHLAIIGANIIYGLNYVIAKGIMPVYMTPRTVILFRVTGAVAAFWIISIFFAHEKVEKKDLLKLFVLAFFGVALNQIMFFEGLNLTTPINASIIMVGVPIAVLVFSHYLLNEKLSRLKLMGIILGSAGALWLILKNGEMSFSSSTFLGNIFIVINATSYSVFLVLIKPMMSKYSPVTIMKWVFTFGLIYVFPVSITQAIHVNYGDIPFEIWLSLTYVVFFTTVLAYLLNNFSLKAVSPTVNSAYIYLQPFLASVVALSLGRDTLTWVEIVAASLIFTGVYFVSIAKGKNI